LCFWLNFLEEPSSGNVGLASVFAFTNIGFRQHEFWSKIGAIKGESMVYSATVMFRMLEAGVLFLQEEIEEDVPLRCLGTCFLARGFSSSY